MKLLFIITLMASISQGYASSIVPARIVMPFLDIFSSKNIEINQNQIEVQVTTYKKRGNLQKGKETKVLSKSQFNFFKTQSSAVYQMDPAKVSPGSVIHYGTAFHIGDNLVLTNQHVLSPDRSNESYCSGFELKDRESQETFKCKLVHFCDKDMDICLIEMKHKEVCKKFFCSTPEIKQLKDGPSFRLSQENLKFIGSNQHVLTAIGNPLNMGIHLSQGKGYVIQPANIIFYAPVRGGNSGGPLIGEDGLVYGVVRAESSKKVGDNTDKVGNMAIPIENVIAIMRQNLAPEVLERFENTIAK